MPPKMKLGLIQRIRMGKSICHKWVNFCTNDTMCMLFFRVEKSYNKKAVIKESGIAEKFTPLKIKSRTSTSKAQCSNH